MRTLILVRHGESEANRVGTFDGYPDAALTELGRAQARSAAEGLAALGMADVRLIASQLQRAVHTADAIGRALGIEPAIDPRLASGEGRAGQTFESAGGEVAQALEEAAEGWDGSLIVVSHRFPIRGYLQTLYGATAAAALVNALGNGNALEISFDGGRASDPVHHRFPGSAQRSG